MNSRFKIFAPFLQASLGKDGKRRLHGVASSTVKDHHGDTMTRSALLDMERRANENLTIFLNHEYRIPEDVAGSVERATLKNHPVDKDIMDLVFDIRINDANDRAVKAWEAIQNGTQLGLSIGARIPDGGAVRDNKGAYEIQHVDLLETSLVGVPANPRSWVEYAVKSISSQVAVADPVEDAGEPDVQADEDDAVFASAVELLEASSSTDATSSDTEYDLSINSDGSADPVVEEVAPDISDATVNIKTPFADISIDTGRGGKSTPDASPQGLADDEASPDTGEDGEERVANALADLELSGDDLIDGEVQSALQMLEPTVVASLSSSSAVLKAITRELIDTKAALQAKNDEYEEVVKTTERIVKETARILDQLANTPTGRRSVVREASDKFAGLQQVYGQEFLSILKKE